MRLIDEEVVHSQLLETQPRDILRLFLPSLFEFALQAPLRLLQFFDRRIAPPRAFRLFAGDELVEQRDLLHQQRVKGLIAHRELFKAGHRHNHRVPIPGRNAIHQRLTLAWGEVFRRCGKDVRSRVELQEGALPLTEEVVGDNNHWFLREAKAPQFHGTYDDRSGLASSNLVCQQHIAAR